MARNLVLLIQINGQAMDTLVVRVLDSAESHGRDPAATNALVLTYADDIYARVQNDDYDQTFEVEMGDGRRMIFRRPSALEVGCHTVLFHVDMARADKAAQMKKRDEDYEKRFGGSRGGLGMGGWSTGVKS